MSPKLKICDVDSNAETRGFQLEKDRQYARFKVALLEDVGLINVFLSEGNLEDIYSKRLMKRQPHSTGNIRCKRGENVVKAKIHGVSNNTETRDIQHKKDRKYARFDVSIQKDVHLIDVSQSKGNLKHICIY